MITSHSIHNYRAQIRPKFKSSGLDEAYNKNIYVDSYVATHTAYFLRCRFYKKSNLVTKTNRRVK